MQQKTGKCRIGHFLYTAMQQLSSISVIPTIGRLHGRVLLQGIENAINIRNKADSLRDGHALITYLMEGKKSKREESEIEKIILCS